MNNEQTRENQNQKDQNEMTDPNISRKMGTSASAGATGSSSPSMGQDRTSSEVGIDRGSRSSRSDFNAAGSRENESRTEGGTQRSRNLSGQRDTGVTESHRFSQSRMRTGRDYRNQRSSSSGSGMTGLWAVLAGIGAGMATMYMLDPNRGGRRRGVLRDQFMSAGSRMPRAARGAAADLSNRAYGMWAEATRLFSSDNPSDQVIEARVRSKMGRVISHPHAVHVSSQDGHVVLDGVILSEETDALISCVENVRGVQSVENRLREFDSPEGISSLQGGRSPEERSGAMQQNWSPAARLGAGAVGLGLGAVGAALVARSFTSSGGRTAITIDKAINVNASPDVLYALWSNFENFPQFMTNVLEVRNTGENRSHWKVAGPAGVPVEWDAETTKVVPNELIAWRSVPGSTVENAGYVLFEPNEDGSTEVTVRLSYNPPAGMIGHAVATAFGADPKTEMDEDLMRMKSLLETGSVPHDAAEKIFDTPRGRRVH